MVSMNGKRLVALAGACFVALGAAASWAGSVDPDVQDVQGHYVLYDPDYPAAATECGRTWREVTNQRYRGTVDMSNFPPLDPVGRASRPEGRALYVSGSSDGHGDVDFATVSYEVDRVEGQHDPVTLTRMAGPQRS